MARGPLRLEPAGAELRPDPERASPAAKPQAPADLAERFTACGAGGQARHQHEANMNRLD